MIRAAFVFLISVCTAVAQNASTDHTKNYPEPTPGDYVAHNFTFKSGESLPEVRIHYYTLGTPQRDANGVVRNAVLILHGTGGSGRQFFGSAASSANFAEQLFGPGQLLDASKYFIVMPDNVGHGGSSKPSDGLRMKFPHYDYDDMVRLQHDLLAEGLQVKHLRLVMGTSMGCMHSWVWAETYPDFIDAAMPLACEPTEIAGRNRIWRKALMDAIRADPKWNDGNYAEEPIEGLTDAEHLLIIVGLAPLQAQRTSGTREVAEKVLSDRTAAALKTADANDMLYYFDASRDYNPEPNLEKIRVPVVAVNSADDFINPPELGVMDRDIKRVAKGRYVLIPISDATRGHGSHTVAKLWKDDLAELLAASQPGGPPLPPSASGQYACSSLNASDVSPAYYVDSSMKRPQVTFAPDPEYSDDARKKKIQGEVDLCVIVGPDGRVHAAAVAKPLYASLDEKAVEAVKTWKFEPGTRNGVPVGTRLAIQVWFRLY